MYLFVSYVALAATLLMVPQSALAVDDAPQLPEIVQETDIISEVAPIVKEAEKVLSPHLLELQQKLRNHPSQKSAEQRVCEAQWSILLGQSNYYPRLDASVSGGSKWIDQTTRADEFGGTSSPEYDGSGINGTLTLRQHIFDWGRNASVIKGYRQDKSIAEIEKHSRLDEQLSTLMRMMLQYMQQEHLIKHFSDSKLVIDKDVDSMEERFKAGAARLAETRQAKLVGLEAENRLTQSQRQRDLVVQAMKTQFGVSPQQAEAIVQSFIENRPEIPDMVPAAQSPQARLIRYNIDKAKSDDDRLRAERLPSFTGVVTARGWDIGQKNRCNSFVEPTHPDAGIFVGGPNGLTNRRDQNCSTHEVIGALEFSVPLYDGGANRAQRGGVSARRLGLESELAAHQRSHNTESRRVQDQLLDELTQLAETLARIEELETQIASERLLQTRTRSNLLSLLNLEQRFSDETGRHIALIYRTEVTRVDALVLAGQLARTLTISLGESGC